jgi:hypothetical protein
MRRRRDLVERILGLPQEDRSSNSPEGLSTGQRIGWVVAGMVALLAVMYLFGWA